MLGNKAQLKLQSALTKAVLSAACPAAMHCGSGTKVGVELSLWGDLKAQAAMTASFP